MPTDLKGKKYPYTKAGKAAARSAIRRQRQQKRRGRSPRTP